MTGTPDLFGDAVPADRPIAPPPAPPRAAAPLTPCTRPFVGPYRCRVGGGDASFSDDDGRSWLCRAHLPPGFLPQQRRRR